MDVGKRLRIIGVIDLGKFNRLALAGLAWPPPRRSLASQTSCSTSTKTSRNPSQSNRRRAVSNCSLSSKRIRNEDKQFPFDHKGSHFGHASEILDAVGLGEIEIAARSMPDIITRLQCRCDVRQRAGPSRLDWRSSTCTSPAGQRTTNKAAFRLQRPANRISHRDPARRDAAGIAGELDILNFDH